MVLSSVQKTRVRGVPGGDVTEEPGITSRIHHPLRILTSVRNSDERQRGMYAPFIGEGGVLNIVHTCPSGSLFGGSVAGIYIFHMKGDFADRHVSDTRFSPAQCVPRVLILTPAVDIESCILNVGYISTR